MERTPRNLQPCFYVKTAHHSIEPVKTNKQTETASIILLTPYVSSETLQQNPGTLMFLYPGLSLSIELLASEIITAT